MRKLILMLLLASNCLVSVATAKSEKSSSKKSGNWLVDGLTTLFPNPMISVSYGTVDWTPNTPSEGLSFENGWMLEGQMGFDIFVADLVLGYKVSTMGGKSDYDYTDPNNENNKHSDDNTYTRASFAAPFLALRVPLIGFLPLRPYIQGGVEAGSANLKYEDVKKDNPSLNVPDSETKLYSGAFGEAGIELVIFKKVMLSASARYSKVSTAKFLSLGNQGIGATGVSYLGTIGARF